MTSKQTKQHPVSPGNPCPFLRALVAAGQLADGQEPIGKIVSTIVEVAKKGDGAPKLPQAAIYGIAMAANGLGPLALLRSNTQGVQLNELRNGPLDKKGAGSAIINSTGEIDATQLARLKTFASPKAIATGVTVLGLDSSEITKYMNANFKRAKGRRRLVDRALMEGEWPVLLKVMGKDGEGGRYLAFDDVQMLFVERRLPARMVG